MSSNLHAPEPADAEPIVAEVVDAAPAKRNRNPFVFALKAIEIRLRFIIVLVAVAVVVGQWDWIKNTIDKWTRPSEGAELDGGIEFYCPMEPHVVRHEYDPGGRVPKCPICRMDLVLRKKGEPVHLPDGVLARAGFAAADPVCRHRDGRDRPPSAGARVADRRLCRLR
jgi:hypothetical protein